MAVHFGVLFLRALVKLVSQILSGLHRGFILGIFRVLWVVVIFLG